MYSNNCIHAYNGLWRVHMNDKAPSKDLYAEVDTKMSGIVELCSTLARLYLK